VSSTASAASSPESSPSREGATIDLLRVLH
jgi:hypothetical protein